jgi:hypothetical protein
MNKYVPHVIVIPEDRADEQLANGFVDHDQVKAPRIVVARPAGGWREVIKVYKEEYIPYLRGYKCAHVVMLIDFDNDYAARRPEIELEIPADLKDRTFVVGPADEPETLKAALVNGPFEDIGGALADECYKNTNIKWSHAHLVHNNPELARLSMTVKGFVF